jgi:hypothetical protein
MATSRNAPNGFEGDRNELHVIDLIEISAMIRLNWEKEAQSHHKDGDCENMVIQVVGFAGKFARLGKHQTDFGRMMEYYKNRPGDRETITSHMWVK